MIAHCGEGSLRGPSSGEVLTSEVTAVPLIRFTNKEAEGFVLLASRGEVRGYPGKLYSVSPLLLDSVQGLFRRAGITYELVGIEGNPGSVAEEEQSQ